MRGSHDELEDAQVESRSIPVCAGEPPLLRITRRRLGVDPRVCGGAGLELVGSVA